MEKNLMPLLFIGHGSPMNAIEDNEFTKNFVRVAKEIERPKAIVCISAHWFTNGTKVTAMEKPKTIHDFFGFPQELYHIDYPANGDIELANEIKNLFSPVSVELNNDWGLDHGTWSILRHMYPDADIPVVQISIDYNEHTQYHFDLSKKLSSLRSKGILIIGSGNIVHNLGKIDFKNIETSDYGYDWAKSAQNNVDASIVSGDFNFLIDYKKDGNDLNMAIPTPEHFLPLIYILGLKEENEKIEFFNNVLVGGSISMTSLKIS
ncbi:MAG: 4,5-DOPA dioxygenase extradiol [Candidatus Nomurabacteria bacterium]|nr:4,5-DOPA dioxygenase extradiol [Candidatus Nomurabacteria bacterium]